MRNCAATGDGATELFAAGGAHLLVHGLLHTWRLTLQQDQFSQLFAPCSFVLCGYREAAEYV